jgi:starch synthase
MSKKVLFAASEVYPFAKTGGLADVAHALPRALNAYDIEVIMPLYQSVDRVKYNIVSENCFFDVSMGETHYRIETYGCTHEGVKYRFVYHPMLCEREFLYGTPEAGYEDNALRFGLFSHTIYTLLREDHYDIVHLNDWQCALTALLMHDDPAISTKSLYTIHNLAYQGVFDPMFMGDLGIETSRFTMNEIEFYGQINLMKAGIAYADCITTVSPTYAKEIMTPEFGCGLEGFLQLHRAKLSGIINGIDHEHFSPAHDTALTAFYNEPKGKKINKNTLLKELGLKGTSKPLFAFIGRFVSQKGMDLLIEILPKMAELECTIALLGEGEEGYYDRLRKLEQHYPNLHLTYGYDESFSHRLYAAADFLLMPSLFEPCGLNQMIAFSYGAVPLVHRVGGLADTVKKFESFDPKSREGYGVVFNTPTPRSLLLAVRKGLDLYADKKRFEQLVAHNMQCDFSWSESAKAYAALYESLIKEGKKCLN